MYPIMWLLAAVVAGLVVQPPHLPAVDGVQRGGTRAASHGTVMRRGGGRRYRGGRAFVALAVDDAGVVRDAARTASPASPHSPGARTRPCPGCVRASRVHRTPVSERSARQSRRALLRSGAGKAAEHRVDSDERRLVS